jgi:hypothetical protein
MKLPVTIAALFLATTTALPAFAAPANISTANRISEASVELVQYGRVSPSYRFDRQYVDRNWDGYGAYAASPASRHAFRDGQPCVSGLDRGAASAFPSWALCSGR